MQRSNWHGSAIMAALGLSLAVAACGGGGSGSEADAGPGGGVDAAPSLTDFDKALASRKVDYGQALRTASLKLTGDLPTLAEIKFVSDAADQKAAYESVLDGYLKDARFARQLRDFFRDTMRMGGGDMDTAPNLAAMLTVEDMPFTGVFTAATGNCPTFDEGTGQFAPADCASGAPVQAGVLTNPAVMKQFVSHMAFRRVRWVQETFDCTKFPTEISTPQNVGGAASYTSPWAFASIAGKDNGGTIDFHDVSAVVCANCHTTMNHQAPLFAHFDDNGMWQMDFAVTTPAMGEPKVVLSDYLPAGETTAWRFGVPVTDLATFGQAMSTDPAVSECMVARVWNWALGKGDIVTSLAIVPPEVIQAQIAAFSAGGYKLKDVIKSVYTSDDFVKW